MYLFIRANSLMQGMVMKCAKNLGFCRRAEDGSDEK